MNDLVTAGIVNMGEFQAKLKHYLAVTSRDLPNGVNSKMFFIARGASRLSPKADPAKIDRDLGVVGYRVRVGKRGKPLMRNGKVRWERQISNTATLAAKIINSRLGRAGKKGLYGSKMAAATFKMISKRRSSTGTVKAGWLNAIRGFGAAVGEQPYQEISAWRLKGRSKFKVAKDGFSPEASLEYSVNSYTPDHSGYIDNRTRKALAQAFADEMKSMEKYIIDKMQKRVNQMSRP